MRESSTDADDNRSTMEVVRDLTTAAGDLRHAVQRRSGLSETELVALQHLADTAYGPADLARLLDVSTAASTGIVDRLERRGHVVRRPHAVDRRRTEVHLTDSGRDEILQLLMPMLVALRSLDEDFDEAEHEVVRRYLRGATAAFARVSQDER